MPNKQKNNSASTFDYIQLFGVIASASTPLLILILRVKASEGIVASCIFLLLFAGGLLWRLWHKAVKAYVHHKPLPPPAIFWRILFHKLPPSRGRSIITKNIRILVVYDPSTKNSYDKLKLNFQNSSQHNLEITPYEYRKDHSEDITDALEKSQALYLFLGEEISQDEEFQDTINTWSERETQKPILVVEKNKKPYTLPFDVIPDAEASTGLWRLLARSIERTTAWYEQSTDYRNVWAITGFFTILFFVSSIFLYYRYSNLQSKIGKMAQIVPNQHQITSRDFQSIREEIAAAVRDSKRDYSLQFTDNEVVNAKKMIGALQSGADPASKFLYDRLTPQTKELLNGYGSTWQPDGALVKALVKDLNCILKDPELFNSNAFRPSEEARRLAEQHPQAEDLMRLNRMLIEDTYPSELVKKSKDDPTLKNKVQNTLNNYALYSFNDLTNRMSDPQEGEGHMSFWRTSSDGTYYQQVARSHPGQEYRTFETTQSPIVRCAIENNAFILWTKDQVELEEAVWGLDGQVIGHRKGANIEFDKEASVPRCNRVDIPGDDKTTGLLCVGLTSIPQNKGIKSAVCIDVPFNDVSFLKESGTRNYLLQTLSIMHLLPNEVLKFNPECKK